MTVWLDTNVLLRFLTGKPTDLAGRARRILRRAADGELVLRVTPVVIAELIWVLRSVYRTDVNSVGDAIRSIALAKGIDVADEEVVLEAVRLMEDTGVDYPDAFVAASARVRGEAVATFDADFKRLGVEIFA